MLIRGNTCNTYSYRQISGFAANPPRAIVKLQSFSEPVHSATLMH